MASGTASRILRAGRALALAGVVLPLLLIGGLKFTSLEIEGLKPMIGGTPWMSWLYRVFGEVGASYLLGSVEIVTALLLVASRWSARAGVAGGLLASVLFLGTCSMFASMPVWERTLGGFPALSGVGQFLIKDVALLGISLTILGENLARLAGPAENEVA